MDDPAAGLPHEAEATRQKLRSLIGAPLAERRIPDALAARLEQLIDNRELLPGDRLPPERELAVMFNASRASMREALSQLVLKGLIDRRPGRGTVVLDRSTSMEGTTLDALQSMGANLSDAWDFRAVMEPAVAERAAQRATRADLIRLEEMLRFMDRDEALPSFPSFDRQFHGLIARSCHNPLLVSVSHLAFEWIEATRDEPFTSRERWEISRRGHHEIFDAIASGDPMAARQAMANHLADVFAAAMGGE